MEEISNEIPVAPPSIKWLFNKNPFRPNDAENIPMRINIKSLNRNDKIILNLICKKN